MQLFFILGDFLLFSLPNTPKNKTLKKRKKTPEYIIILHMFTKNYDQMMYGFWDMVLDRCNCYLSFWVMFCPFTLLTPQKIKILKKWKKTPGDVIILLTCTKNYDQMMYSSQDMLRDRWTDKWTDGRTDGWKDGRKKLHIEVGAPPQNSFVAEVTFNSFFVVLIYIKKPKITQKRFFSFFIHY